MKFNNPVIKGFYPDPSVCKANGAYYMVCSSFQFFPGVPLFESKDLINWTQIGHVLTRKSQVMLEGIRSSGGVFAPTIRYNEGRFYMTTTNDSTRENFIVYTDDIYGEWSDPIYIDQGGIDPDLYFEGDRTYFMSNGSDEDGRGVILQCEIDRVTGAKLSPSTPLWKGTGGRFLESPHMYFINGWYYLMVAEGGTEFGHMITYARSKSLHGPFEPYALNPVITNRDLGGYEIQAIGHGDLVEDDNGNWWLFHLGFRQIGQWIAYHHLGREVFLAPVTFNEDGWFTAGHNGHTIQTFESDRLSSDLIQLEKKSYTFNNTNWNIDWAYLRHPNVELYQLADDQAILTGSSCTLDEPSSPTFIALRQKDFNATIQSKVDLFADGEAGITLYMDENHHYDLAITNEQGVRKAILKLTVGDLQVIKQQYSLEASKPAHLVIESRREYYYFYVQTDHERIELGKAQAKYLSSEVAGGFTGVMIGIYAIGQGATATFTDFECLYE